MTSPENLPSKALSVRQPWAWAICSAGKAIENRSWSTGFRGGICIHAAGGMTAREYAEAAQFMLSIGIEAPRKEVLTKGAIVATASIVGCVSRSPSPWFFGPFGLVLQDVQPIEPIPCKGALGFFDWRAGLLDQARGKAAP